MSYFKYDGVRAAETAAPAADFYGTGGVDTLTGTAVSESFWGGEGDLMQGGAGDDTYWLKSFQDRVSELAGQGADKIAGWQNLSLDRFPNFENIYVGGDKTYGAGDAADNVIEGGAGSQQLYGGGGQDVLVGGGGADTFIVYKGEGADVVQDFSAEDVVRLKAGFTSFAQLQQHLSQVGADVKLDMGGNNGLIFRNLTVGQLSASNFQLQADVGSLTRTFADEFTGPVSLYDKESNPTGTWRTEYGYQGAQGVGSYTLVSNDEKQIYTSPYFRDHAGDFSESPFVSNGDGTLSIIARPSTNAEIFGYGYTSGMLSTQATFSQTYGYFEMRADIPDAAGAWPAFWLIPTDGSWPPELDVMETLTSDDNATWTTKHSGIGGHSSQGQLNYVPDTADGFHTYGALWTPADLVYYIDGVEVMHTPTPADMNKPMFMIANLALGGWGGAIDQGDLPAEMKIDYIHAYALPGATTASGTTAPAPVPAPAPSVVAPAAGDAFDGTSGADTLQGGVAQDHLWGGDGDDRISGGDAFDNLHGNVGDDTVAGGAGDDWVVGGKDNDLLSGDEGGDVVLGNLGDDRCDGGAGVDVVRGGQGNDVVLGQDGNDWLSGDRGNDTVTGGAGADIFHGFGDAGLDRITDFNFAEGDRVQLIGGTVWHASQVGQDVVIDMSGGAQMVLKHVQLGSLGDGWIFGA